MNRLIRHVGVYVENIQKIREFYEKVFSMKVVAYAEEELITIPINKKNEKLRVETMKMLADGGTLLEFVRLKESCQYVEGNRTSHFFEPGAFHLAFSVTSISDCLNKIKKFDGIVLTSKNTLVQGGRPVVFCRDCEGNFVELIEVSDGE